jgi:Fur family peroxide stress response transcriptional regulator
MSLQELKQLLLDNGIKPSMQRLKILQFMVNNKDHPSVDNVYSHLLGEMPTLSKTTVYSTLSLFAGKKIIMALLIDENEIRYDYWSDPHGHLKCKNCGNLYDIPLNDPVLKLQPDIEHKIDNIQIHYSGICKKCLN